MTTISVRDLASRLANEPDSALIDVRTDLEFDHSHVPRALSVPLDTFVPADLSSRGVISEGRAVYLLCQSGQRAGKAADILAREGYENVFVVEGGTQAWIDARLPVVEGERKTIGLERQVRIAAGSLVLTGFLLGWFVNRYFFCLSGFVGAGLIFAGISGWCGMGLLIAKAPWNRRRSA